MNTNNPLITIIVPVYKAEKYLERCIESIISQTFKDWELILVDDGSPDKSGSICDRYAIKDDRIRVYHKENGGVSSARNVGLRHSTGRYVTFIDSDDWVSTTYLEDFRIENYRKDGIVIISQGIKQYFPEKKLHIDMFKYEDKELRIDSNPISLINYNILANGCPVAKIFDLNIIKMYNLYFNERISLNEDHLFVLDYIYHTTTIITRSTINYTYMYDFTIPSLTKNRHSSQDSFNAAIALWKSFNDIVHKYEDINEYFKIYYKEFGPKQLIRASKSVFNEAESFKKFVRIALEFKNITSRKDLLQFNDFYSKSYVYLINKFDIKVFYLLQYVIYIHTESFNRIRFIIKRLIRIR